MDRLVVDADWDGALEVRREHSPQPSAPGWVKAYPGPLCCARCTDRCCQRAAGGLLPSDLGLLPQARLARLGRLLRTRRYVLDDWYGDPKPGGRLGRVLFPRPAHVGGPWPYDPSGGGTCVWLTAHGCTMHPTRRPAVCRGLVPDPGGNCQVRTGDKSRLSKEGVALSWRPYARQLEALLRELRTESEETIDAEH